MKKILALVVIALVLASVAGFKYYSNYDDNVAIKGQATDRYTSDNIEIEIPLSDGFDLPLGQGFYALQNFGENNHLGEDWNDYGYCDSDMGAQVHAIANGYVSVAKDLGGGWGNVVRVIHKYQQDEKFYLVESLYAHLESLDVQKGQNIVKGQKVGTIGNANGRYCAHLHLELRTEPGLPLGGGYSDNTEGFMDPSDFIEKF